MRRFAYHEPKTLEEASRLLVDLGENAHVLAGGTDLFVEIRERLRDVSDVVNIKNIPGMTDITWDPAVGLTFGALVTARQLETLPGVQRTYPNFAEALRLLASIQVRNRATVVGNLCRASPSADTIPPLIADGAIIHIYTPKGMRRMPLAEFFTGPGRTRLERGDIATGIVIPAPAPDSGRIYLKHGRRKAMELATVGVAVSLDRDGDTCTNARIALGAVGPTVLRASAAEALLKGRKITDELIAQVGAQAMAECTPISNVRASAEYRRSMVGVLTRRAVKTAMEATQ
ncbi:carbon-monoxide dehydrogenase medium subunit [Mameliella alba]|uniref:FAD binding domain-containing protein n=1 Tax=Mameliella alba TaxID=561184 RepID=UPI000886C92F|nr:xanthine dehydrogenase family protein subunit M [Mameliella alba]OWV41384.1 dehydrogenase [Mameliella alba]PTR38940.1 carbon-monoxide dehydrogenase medium subunit [Mameliella alba]GGF70765.1 dehydrogenase [Mameliella alba]SDD48472.1 carbon-monoxide dehydrogenase medium subunit [Mameliella alba]